MGMLTPYPRRAALVALVCLSMALSALAESSHDGLAALELTTEEYPPFNYRNDQGNVDGIATRIVEAALRQTGLHANFRLLPWARALAEARYRPGHCVYSATRSPDRENSFRWVGPLVTNHWMVYGGLGRALEVNSLDDLANLRVGGFRDDVIADYVAAQGINVLLATTDRENLRRLQAGMIDVWITGREPATVMAQQTGIPVQLLHEFNETGMYLACHPDVPESQLNALQSAVDDLRSDGTMAAIRADVYEALSVRPAGL